MIQSYDPILWSNPMIQSYSMIPSYVNILWSCGMTYCMILMYDPVVSYNCISWSNPILLSHDPIVWSSGMILSYGYTLCSYLTVVMNALGNNLAHVVVVNYRAYYVTPSFTHVKLFTSCALIFITKQVVLFHLLIKSLPSKEWFIKSCDIKTW